MAALGRRRWVLAEGSTGSAWTEYDVSDLPVNLTPLATMSRGADDSPAGWASYVQRPAPQSRRAREGCRAPDQPVPDTSGATMRKLIVSNLISLDGYASRPGGDVMALPFDTTFSDNNLELMRAADTLVSGAVRYRGFVSYWPPVADDPAQPEVERAISRRHRELEHLVVSDSLTAEGSAPCSGRRSRARCSAPRSCTAMTSSPRRCGCRSSPRPWATRSSARPRASRRCSACCMVTS